MSEDARETVDSLGSLLGGEEMPGVCVCVCVCGGGKLGFERGVGGKREEGGRGRGRERERHTIAHSSWSLFHDQLLDAVVWNWGGSRCGHVISVAGVPTRIYWVPW